MCEQFDKKMYLNILESFYKGQGKMDRKFKKLKNFV
jgi:hypothetical protein